MNHYFGNPWLIDIERTPNLEGTRFGKYRLDKNEWIGDYPKIVTGIVRDALNSEVFCAYPETNRLYEELAYFHNKPANYFHVTAGIDGAIKNCFEVFTRAGDEVVTISPTYAMVDVYSSLFRVKQIQIKFAPDLSIDVERLIDIISSQTKLVIIANPNSPTGTVMSQKELSIICQQCNDLNVPVLIDEAYYGFSKVTMEPFLQKFRNLMIARTFSKAFGLAGFRVGYLVSNPGLISVLKKFKPMYEISNPSVIAATAMLKNFSYVESYCADVIQSKCWLINNLQAKSVPTVATDTNFIHIDFGDNKDLILSQLAASNFLLQGGLRLEPYKTYSRVSIGTISVMRKFLSSIKELI